MSLALETAPQVLQDTSCGEVWKLQLAELLMQDWLLLPQQAVHLLNMFDRQAGACVNHRACSDIMWGPHTLQCKHSPPYCN